MMKAKKLFTKKNNGLLGAIENALSFSWFNDEKANALNLEYFLFHSAEKTLSIFVLKLLEMNGVDLEDDVYDDGTTYDDIAKIVKSRYSNRWNRIYEALTEEYSLGLIEHYESTETPNITKEINQEKTSSKTSKNTNEVDSNLNDTNTSETTENTKYTGTDTHENSKNSTSTTNIQTDINKTLANDRTENNVYAFDSTEEVPASNSLHNSLEHTEGDYDKNKQDVTTSETSTDKESRDLTDNKTSNDSSTLNRVQKQTSKGDNTESGNEGLTSSESETGSRKIESTRSKGDLSEEIMKAIQLRDITIDKIIMDDLDALLTTPVYDY